MPDGFSILAFLGSIKTAKETASLILDASKSLEKAELEYKIASLTKTLAELETQARDFEKILQEKDRAIEEIEKRLKFKTNLVRQDGCYFDKEELEKNSYEPFCSQCWEVENLPVHLTLTSSVILHGQGNPRRLMSYVCPTCSNPYEIYQPLKVNVDNL